MSEKFDPTSPFAVEVQRDVTGRVETAAMRLELLIEDKAQDADEIAKSVHEVRKQIKAARGAIAFLGDNVGNGVAKAEAALRSAGRSLSSMRDAHVMLETVADLRPDVKGKDRGAIKTVKRGLAKRADRENATIAGDDERLVKAADQLSEARRYVDRWKVDPVVSLGPGLDRAYRRGQRRLDKARRSPSDDHMHRLRKSVKVLFNQVVLLESDAPSTMSPIVKQLDLLGDLLGGHNDLAVLRAHINNSPKAFGGKKAVKRVTKLANARQKELRVSAFAVAETVYGEDPSEFVSRVETNWGDAHRNEPIPASHRLVMPAMPYIGQSTSPRQRRFLVDQIPELPSTRLEVVIGYLAVDGEVAVWIENAGPGHRLLKVAPNADPLAHDLKARLSDEAFEAAWPSTAGRRLHKTRHVLEASGHVVELAAYAERLEGLRVVTAGFDSPAAAAAFEPPAWFGREISEDRRYVDVLLVIAGLASEHFV